MEQYEYQYKNPPKGWDPLPPIDFTVLGQEGINLTDAINQNFSNLEGRDDSMFEGESTGNSVSCRIDVRGRYYISFRFPQLLAELACKVPRKQQGETGTVTDPSPLVVE